MNFNKNTEWTALEKRIENLKCKIMKPKRRKNSQKNFKFEKKISSKHIYNNSPQNHRRNRSGIESSRIELFISSEEYLSQLIKILKKQYNKSKSFSEEINDLNKRFILSNSNHNY